MSTIRTQFGPVTNFTLTLNGLASSSGRSSAKVENQSSRYIDAICQFKLKTVAGSPSDRYAIYFFAWGSADDVSTAFPAGTLITPPFSVAPAFGNVLPPVWGILAINRSGLALDATDNIGFWRGVEFEVS